MIILSYIIKKTFVLFSNNIYDLIFPVSLPSPPPHIRVFSKGQS